jgi:hypothetical protein
VTRPRGCTTNWWPFPPTTREVQFDEKWNFVAKKEKSCDPADPGDGDKGDDWDHTAVDPESRLLLAVVPGERSAENCKQIVREAHRRAAGDASPRWVRAVMVSQGRGVGRW